MTRFPNTRKPCPGCGEVSRARGAGEVCGKCKHLLNIGKQRLEELESPKAGMEYWRMQEVPYAIRSYSYDSKTSGALVRAIHQLIMEMSEPCAWNGYGDEWVIDTLKNSGVHFDTTIRMTREHRELLNRIDGLIRSVASESFEAGKREGLDLLRSLASGETSVQDWNEATMGER